MSTRKLHAAVLVTWKPKRPFAFSSALAATTGWTVQTIGVAFPRAQKGLLKALVVWPLYVLVPLRFFLLQLPRYERIVCWQQAYGVVLGLLLQMFRRRCASRIAIVAFIVLPAKRKGLARYLINRALECKQIAAVLVHSEHEAIRYREVFPSVASKIKFVLYTAADIPNLDQYDVGDDGYYLSVGRSNRDYEFLVRYFELHPERSLEIVTDEALGGVLPSNVKVRRGEYGEDMFKRMSKCKAVILTFQDDSISAGQLVFLQAIQFGKPVICTSAAALRDYVEDGVTGMVIGKTEDELNTALKKVEQPSFYRDMTGRASATYAKRFGFRRFAQDVADAMDLNQSASEPSY